LILDIGIRYKYDALAAHFVEYAKLFAKDCSQDVIDAEKVRLKERVKI